MLPLLQAANDQKVDVPWATDGLVNIVLIMLAGFAVIFVVGAGILIFTGRARHRRLAKSGINDIDKMGGQVFEQYLEVLFTRLGYMVERTRFVGDFGGDLVIRKDGVKTVVQAKRWTNSVGVKAVQEAVAARGYYDCTEAMVVTNSSYTQQARTLARKNQVTLWDRDRLVMELESTRARDTMREQSAVPPGVAPPPIAPVRSPSEGGRPLATVATCRICAKVLSSGERTYCEANSKRFRGEMFCFRHQRSRRPMASS